MELLLAEMAVHDGLAKLFAHVGHPGFWRALIAVLGHYAPADNAMAAFFEPNAAPRILEICTFEPNHPAGAISDYGSGMYLLDPFFHLACDNRIGSGFFRLDDVAPDQFRSCEYYMKYFSHEVGDDEVQFQSRLASGGTLSLSLGSRTRFDPQAVGRLLVVRGWVAAAMERHWASLTAARDGSDRTLVDKVRNTIFDFGKTKLSEREAQIAQFTLRGFSVKTIAQRVQISPETVKVHRRNMYLKMGATSQADLFSCFIAELQRPD
jgi:DNA-binding CsgD family transcriptional regulator